MPTSKLGILQIFGYQRVCCCHGVMKITTELPKIQEVYSAAHTNPTQTRYWNTTGQLDRKVGCSILQMHKTYDLLLIGGHQTTGSTADTHLSGRPRVTTADEDWYIHVMTLPTGLKHSNS